MNETDQPTAFETHKAIGDWRVLPSYLPVADMGVMPVNSFLLKARQTMLVDTGSAPLADELLAALHKEIDLADLDYIWLSHADADHTGGLRQVMEQAPNARILTTFLGTAKLGLQGFDTSRVELIEPGGALMVGGHRLQVMRPPYYDAPETTGFFDLGDQLLFSADAFGALLPQPEPTAEAITPSALRDGMQRWSQLDAPWLADIDQRRFARTLQSVAALEPKQVLSSHLPLAQKGVHALAEIIAETWCADTAAAA